MTEKFAERTAGIWLPLVFYAAGGGYMLAFWGLLDRSAYHLTLFGAVSLIVAYALYSMTRWAFWMGLFTFPLFFAEFLFALVASVNFVGWYPNIATAAFNASLVVYLVFLSFSLLLLVDRRNALRSVSIPFLKFPASAPSKGDQVKGRKESKESKD